MHKKALFLIVFIPIAIHLYSLLFLHFGENFHPKHFEHGFDASYTTEVSGLEYFQLDEIFNQPFHHLGQGKQMLAFESADGRYVLKLFNPMRPLKRKWYLEWKYWKRCSSLKWVSREWFGKKVRLKKLFKRHHLAYQYLRKETGLLFVHLSPSERISHYVHIIDNLGNKHIVALNNTPFVLQEKAVLVPNYLNALLEEHNINGAKQAVEQLEHLFAKRLGMGITDRIQTMENNYGFVGTKPIQIDVGRIRMNPELQKNPHEEQERILNNFQSWLVDHYPDLR